MEFLALPRSSLKSMFPFHTHDHCKVELIYFQSANALCLASFYQGPFHASNKLAPTSSPAAKGVELIIFKPRPIQLRARLLRRAAGRPECSSLRSQIPGVAQACQISDPIVESVFHNCMLSSSLVDGADRDPR